MSMTESDIINRFRATGALLDGHFALSSGLHSRVYLQCARVLQHPAEAEKFGQAIAEKFGGREITCVASPAIGGIIIGHEAARALGVKFIFTEREQDVMTLRRGFTVAPHEKVLVVEDVITTGGSTRETITALRQHGAHVVAAASIIDRSNGAADVGVERLALANLNVESFTANDCPMCKQGEPAVKPGSRKKP